MPSYLNHVLTNFALALILLFFYQKNPFLTDTQLGVFLISYFVGSIVITPDIDTRSQASKKCGIFCVPYRWFFTHRGISHNWIYGVVTRIVYVMLIIVFFIALIYGLPKISIFINILFSYKLEILSIVLGLFLSNLFHIMADAIF